MKTLIHNSPVGPLTIAGVLGDIEPGEPFDVDDAIAETLLEQEDLFQLFTPPANPYSDLKLPELKALVLERELAVDGKTKADHIAALLAADTATPQPAPAEQPTVPDANGAQDSSIGEN